MKQTHTPGPWIIDQKEKWPFDWQIVDSEGFVIANGGFYTYSTDDKSLSDVRKKKGNEPCEANAKLIAAAPELLETLKRTYLQLQVVANKHILFALETDSIRADLRNQISLATGKSEREIQETNEAEALKIK
jgi:hypothetical protein